MTAAASYPRPGNLSFTPVQAADPSYPLMCDILPGTPHTV